LGVKMGKKIITKRKIRIKLVPTILLLLIVFLLFFIIKLIIDIKIQNIYIFGNKYLSDDYIIEKADLKDYPSYFLNFSFKISDKLKEDPFIKDASIKKHFFGVVEITVEENKVLFYKEYDKKYVLETKEEVNSLPFSYTPVTLINYVPDTIYDNLLNKYKKINNEIISKISEIKYDPSDYDNSRFMIYMNDGNYVYITLSKFDSINYYNEIYSTLEGKKGILYLDSGNHFVEIKN